MIKLFRNIFNNNSQKWGRSFPLGGGNPGSWKLKSEKENSRELYLTSPYAKRAIDLQTAFIVGNGILPHAELENDERDLLGDKVLAKWADSTACDAREKHNLYGLQKHIVTIANRDGGVLIQKIVDKNELHLGLRLLILNIDHLDIDKTDELDNRNRVVQGVEYNKLGKEIAYWVYDDSRAERYVDKPSKRIKRENLIYFRMFADPDQPHGNPLLGSALETIEDLRQYQRAQLKKQKNSAKMLGFLESDNSGRIDADNPSEINMEEDSIVELPPGRKINIASPLTIHDTFMSYRECVLNDIANATQNSPMTLAQDYSKANYSNARMGRIDLYRMVNQTQKTQIEPCLLEPLSRWILSASSLKGLKTKSIDWSFPREELIDLSKDVAGLSGAVDAGFMAHEDVVKKFGSDPDLHYKKLRKNKKDLEGLLDAEETNEPSKVQKSPN